MRVQLIGALTVMFLGGIPAAAQSPQTQAPAVPAATAIAVPSQSLIVPDAPAPAQQPAEQPVISSPTLPYAASTNGASAWDSRGRFYVGAEYLLWWTKKSPIAVPLVTTTTDLSQMPPATIGANGTSVVLGNQGLDTSTRSGARFTVGWWCDARGELGLEANYFFLASRTVTRSVASNGGPNDPLLAELTIVLFHAAPLRRAPSACQPLRREIKPHPTASISRHRPPVHRAGPVVAPVRPGNPGCRMLFPFRRHTKTKFRRRPVHFFFRILDGRHSDTVSLLCGNDFNRR